MTWTDFLISHIRLRTNRMALSSLQPTAGRGLAMATSLASSLRTSRPDQRQADLELQDMPTLSAHGYGLSAPSGLILPFAFTSRYPGLTSQQIRHLSTGLSTSSSNHMRLGDYHAALRKDLHQDASPIGDQATGIRKSGDRMSEDIKKKRYYAEYPEAAPKRLSGLKDSLKHEWRNLKAKVAELKGQAKVTTEEPEAEAFESEKHPNRVEQLERSLKDREAKLGQKVHKWTSKK